MIDLTGQNTRVAMADAQGIAEAVHLLDSGQIVAVPTETVYGLAADAAQDQAVSSVYRAKGRPDFNPLIVHVADFAMANTLAEFNPTAEKLARRFWPGGLTFVLPRKKNIAISPLVTAGLDTIALRLPAHPVMREIVRQLGRGVAAPSANASGKLSPTQANHVLESLGGRLPLILDGGACQKGLESTIISLAHGEPRLLRQGAIPQEMLEEHLGHTLVTAKESEPVAAPGMLLRHYAPRIPLRLNAPTAEAEEFHIGFGAIEGDLNLSPSGDLAEAASNLFQYLHLAQASGKEGIAVAPIPEAGLGAALHDRLTRAARG